MGDVCLVLRVSPLCLSSGAVWTRTTPGCSGDEQLASWSRRVLGLLSCIPQAACLCAQKVAVDRSGFSCGPPPPVLCGRKGEGAWVVATEMPSLGSFSAMYGGGVVEVAYASKRGVDQNCMHAGVFAEGPVAPRPLFTSVGVHTSGSSYPFLLVRRRSALRTRTAGVQRAGRMLA